MKVKLFSSENPTLLFALEEIKEQLAQFPNPDFLLITFHPKYPKEDIKRLIPKILETDNYFAFETINSIRDRQVVRGIVVCALKFETSGKIELKLFKDYSLKSLELASEIIQTQNNDLHILIGSIQEETFSFVEKLSQTLGKNKNINNILGGLSSNSLSLQNAYTSLQITRDTETQKGFSLLTFKNFHYVIGVALGFKPYGVTYTASDVDGRKLKYVDGNEKFSDVVKRLLRGIQTSPDEQVKLLWHTPLYILDDLGGYVATLRTPARIEKEYVELYAPIEKGTHFKLSFALPEDLIKESSSVAKRLKTELPVSDLLLNFSCLARHHILGTSTKKELEVFSSILNTHIFGFLTFGEIGPDKKFKRLKVYNETSLTVSLKEVD